VDEPSPPGSPSTVFLFGATEPDSRSRSRHYLRHLLCVITSFIP